MPGILSPMPSALLNGLGIAASYAFVSAVIAATTLLVRREVLTPLAARKVIHISVAHWWLLAMAMIDDPWVASVGPLSFIFINALALRFRFLPVMDREGEERNLGTVYFPFSLLVLVNLCWRQVIPVWVGAIAVLVLGWGDGLAALVGGRSRARGFRIWGGRKTPAGSAAMLAASFVVVLILTLAFNPRFPTLLPAVGVSIAVAAGATLVEALTPLGIDNITIPIACVALYQGLFA
jgi:phytol kinase